MKSFLTFLVVLLLFNAVASKAQTGWRKLLNAPAYGFAANPKNPKTIYVGGEARVFYRSYDGGLTWDSTDIGFRGGSEQLTNVVVHPIDTNVVFVGGIRFGTIRRSTDMGKNWEIALSEIQNLTFSGEAIIIDPKNPFIMYACEFQRGVIYKSVTRGRTWFKVSTLPTDSSQNPPQTPRVCSITIHPDSANKMFVGCTGSVIYQSNDSGQTWAKVQQLYKFYDKDSVEYSDSEIPQIRFSTLNPRYGYAVSTYFNSYLKPNGSLIRTTDGGETWRQFALKDTSLWAFALRPLVNNEEIVVGGYTDVNNHIPPNDVPGERVVRRSTDGGDTWTMHDDKIAWPVSEESRKNVFSLQYVGPTPQTQKLYAATESGLYVFDSLNTTGILPPVEKNTLIITQEGRNKIYVQVEGLEDVTEPATVSVFDVLGHAVVSKQQMQKFGKKSYYTKVNLGNVAAGRYFISATHGDLFETTSFQVSE